MLPEVLVKEIMTFLLGTQNDYFQVPLVCKQMKELMKVYKPLCRLEGDFSDDQIKTIVESMKVEGRKGWKPSITIEGELDRSGKITADGLMEILYDTVVQWDSIVFRRIRLGNGPLVSINTGTCLQNLRVLELTDCDGYSSIGFLNFARNNVSRSLQVLRIQPFHRGHRPDRLTDKIFMGFQRLTALRELELRGCCDITDAGLRSYYTFQPDTWLSHPAWDIPEGLARLGQDVKVTLVDCVFITPGCVQELREQYPEIGLQLSAPVQVIR